MSILCLIKRQERKEYVWWRRGKVWGRRCLCASMERHPPFPLMDQPHDDVETEKGGRREGERRERRRVK